MPIRPRQFLLPDLLAICPLEGAKNPHYCEAAPESSAWINSYDVFTDRKRAHFIQGCNELLVAHTYPYTPYEQFRTCCDFVNLLFIVDEISDEQNGRDTAVTGNIFLETMRNPNYCNSSKLAQITKDFRTRYFRTARPVTSARFIEHCADYIRAVSAESELRERGEVLDVDAFIQLRRNNSAVILCFDMIEYALGISLPEEVVDHPTFREMYWAATDMVCWANDVYSWNMEQAKGIGGNNIITVLMKHKNMSLQSACDYVGLYCEELVNRYLSAKARLPSWGSSKLDGDVARYAEACGHWVKGNLDWSFETIRYFGTAPYEVKRTRLVTLRRPCDSNDFDSDSD
ncbi:Sesquiterpene synthase 10 [Marasmius oreades]|uniref:Terpene synthase n=1 Tax=Marasmius oreades TaxID=181124 RepID=A0A9P7RLD4_9AGAR|nr:Sesquiterpene synthase 10 [Marasmius oreades]KAG7085298.1 Sesquiterpene synthase 10 [Marasmius oreades]